MNILLFANGEVNESAVAKIAGDAFDMIIAADGGVHNALAHGFTPQIVIGDLDSTTGTVRETYPDIQWIHRPSQEINDLEKALIYCREIGGSDLTLLGIGGKRLDHTLNNLSVLSRYDEHMRLSIYDHHSQIFFVRDYWEYPGAADQLISLIPLGRVDRVRTKGLAFPLNDEPLHFGEREGLSNYIVSPPASVSVSGGLLLIFALDKKS